MKGRKVKVVYLDPAWGASIMVPYLKGRTGTVVRIIDNSPLPIRVMFEPEGRGVCFETKELRYLNNKPVKL